MKIVVVGAGEVGTYIAKQFVDEGKDVVIIERNAELARRAAASLDCLVVPGEGTSLDILKKAGVASADVFVAATTSDEVNLISCFIVTSEFDVPVKIARVRNEEYTKSQIFSSDKSGMVYIVNTDEEAALEIVDIVGHGAPGNATIFDNISIQLREQYVDANSLYNGKEVKDLRAELKENFLIAAIVRNSVLTIPDGLFKIQEKDYIYIAADKRTFSRLGNKLGLKVDKLHKIAIVGGTPIGCAVAETLSAKGRSVVLIDKDYEVCKRIADMLPDVMVLNGDISDHEFYKEEKIGALDAIITTTLNEELNILSGLYAKTLGVKRAVAVVEKTSYITLAGSLGIDSIVSPKFCAVNSIVKYIRKGNINSIHSIFEGQAEAVEITVSDNSKFAHTALKDIELPDDCRIVAVTRWFRSYIPDGGFVLKPKDRVVFFVKRASVSALEELIKD